MGVMMAIMIIPKIKSSCLPESILGNPNLKMPKYPAPKPNNIHTIPNPRFIASIFFDEVFTATLSA